MRKRKRSKDDDDSHSRSAKKQTFSTIGPARESGRVKHATSLQAPPGMGRRQRRRWRRKQQRLAEQAAGQASVKSSPVAADESTASDTIRDREISQLTSAKLSADDETLLRRYGTTHLQPRPQKRWHDYRSPLASMVADPADLLHKVSAQPLSQTSEDRPSLNDDLASQKMERSQYDTHLPPDHLVEPELSDRQRPSEVSEPHASKNVRPATKLYTMRPSILQTSAPTGKLPDTSSLNIRFSGSGSRRVSFSQKANSISTHTDITDTAAAFQRFSDFIHKLSGRRTEDESDDDSSSSSDDSQAGLQDLPDYESTVPLQVPESEPSRPIQDDRPKVSFQRSSGKIENHEGEEEAEEEQEEEISEPTTPEPERRFRTNREKVRLHNAQQDTPDNGSFTAWKSSEIIDEDCFSEKWLDRSPSIHQDSYNSSDYGDLHQTIDDISRHVFSTTRPLPACKPSAPSDIEQRGGRKRGLTTSPPSIRRLTRSLTIPKEQEIFDNPGLPVPHDTSIACHSVRIPRTKLDPATLLPQQETPIIEERSVTSGKSITEDDDSSGLSELSRSPSPPAPSLPDTATPARKKRKMTGATSKHFTPDRPKLRKQQSAPTVMRTDGYVLIDYEKVKDQDLIAESDTELVTRTTRSTARKQRQGTGRKSSYFTPTKPALDPDIIDRVDFYNTTAGSRNKKVGRVPAGTSTAPVPPITSDRFGIIQEKLWREPFWLIIAVTFLNKTTGRAAAPVFWALKEQYGTPEGLAAAPQEDLEDMVWHLGLQRQRSKRLIKIAQAWIADPPKAGIRHRTLHYPARDDGKAIKKTDVVEEDSEDCAGALEIGHIPGCGPYAWDSWRMFCRDVLRGVAHDYNGSEGDAEGFEPEWKRVLPLDKELRACLRWMWLREGWIWNCETGEKRDATAEEMERAVLGEMEFADMKERAFAAQAAGVAIATPDPVDTDVLMAESPATEESTKQGDAGVEISTPEKIAVTSPSGRPLRRSARLRT